MSFFEIALIGVGLAMDAFAVSICKGLAMRKVKLRYPIIIALFFGGFQAAMPLAGWFIGSRFAEYISRFDHWIAFALIGYIGIKMLFDGIRKGDKEEEGEFRLIISELFLLAIATSIDALAVGITFSFSAVNIWIAIAIVGIVTFMISFAGVFIGNKFGIKYKDKATILGGVILIAIAVKILVEGLM